MSAKILTEIADKDVRGILVIRQKNSERSLEDFFEGILSRTPGDIFREIHKRTSYTIPSEIIS